MEYKAWLYPNTQGSFEREALHPAGQQGSVRRAQALMLEEPWFYSALFFYFCLVTGFLVHFPRGFQH